jgi:hypothetical protein
MLLLVGFLGIGLVLRGFFLVPSCNLGEGLGESGNITQSSFAIVACPEFLMSETISFVVLGVTSQTLRDFWQSELHRK